MALRQKIGGIVEAPAVQNAIMGLIVFNAITLGLETSPTIYENYGWLLQIMDRLVLAIFVIELLAKLIFRGGRFFCNGWNLFDFIIVGVALIPASGPLAILRALRILRAFRLMSRIPQMRTVVQAFITAIPGMLSIVALISLIFYVCAVLATNLFGTEFTEWFGSIGRSMYSLFQIMTLESWSMGIVRPVMKLYPFAWVFFIPFILVTSFAVINLFIGVIVDSMQAQHRDVMTDVRSDQISIEHKIDAVERELHELRQLLRRGN